MTTDAESESAESTPTPNSGDPLSPESGEALDANAAQEENDISVSQDGADPEALEVGQPVVEKESPSKKVATKKKTTTRKVATKKKTTTRKVATKKKAATRKVATKDKSATKVVEEMNSEKVGSGEVKKISPDASEEVGAQSEDGKEISAPEKAGSKGAVKEVEGAKAPVDSQSDSTEKVKEEPEVEVAPPPPPFPEEIELAKYQVRPLADLYKEATEYAVRVPGGKSKHELLFDLLNQYSRRGTTIYAEGVVEIIKDGFGFLRWTHLSFRPNADDVYIASNIIREHGLQSGNVVRVKVRSPRDREKFLSVSEVLEIESAPASEWERPPSFDKLTAMFPSERLILETKEESAVSSRVVDLVAPLGKGQRGLIVAPPRGGKTILLKQIAASIAENHPEVELIVLLLDERPEEVTDFEETIPAPVYSSTFDESAPRHVQVAELVSERAQRLVEMGKDVVILLDSITRLSRGYNNLQGGKGGIMSGGIHQKALQRPRKFFGAARNVEDGGSLTILATALVETGSKMDEVIFEEFKGTGNMEVYIDRELAEQRVFPAIDTLRSGTRKDDLLYHPDEMQRVNLIRRSLAQRPMGEATEALILNIQNTGSNAELLLRGIR